MDEGRAAPFVFTYEGQVSVRVGGNVAVPVVVQGDHGEDSGR